MRQVKFRIWSKKYQLFDSDPKWPNNQYSYDCRFLDSNGNVVIFVDYNGYSLFEDEEKDLIVQFSTGLKDKTGREIYEGDILDIPYGNGRFEVIWGDIGFCAKKIPIHVGSLGSVYYEYMAGMEYIRDKKTNEHLDTINHVEIIGNIFENPEFLKK